MVDTRVCSCGGLAYKCSRFGHLPDSIGYYNPAPPEPSFIAVIWSGTLQRENATPLQLLPDRDERPDSRLWAMPTYDLDDGQVADVRPRRKYTLTGRYRVARSVVGVRKEEQAHG